MTFNEFKEEIKNNILSYLPEEYNDASVEIREVEKNNGRILSGILIQKNGSNVAPNIYLESFYEKMEDLDLDIEDILEEIAKVRVGSEVGSIDVESITDFENVRDFIYPRLINAEANKDMLQNRPYIPFNDLAIVFAIELGDTLDLLPNTGRSSIQISNELFKHWNITINKLKETAIQNLKNNTEVLNMNDFMAELGMPSLEEDIPMYILTNKEKVHGAAVILDEATIETVSEKLGGSFIILPSSVHEVIAIPDSAQDNPLAELVSEINASEVSLEERLSNSVYRYDQKTKKIIAA